ncbi:MAG: carbon-nitrogen hydrolase family protein [Legionellaceae bacterium]|nr:carbon-nitrogen hydrolase family protein [Legionellaceae bacterium]
MLSKIAVIQMCSSDILRDNLERAQVLITEASENGAKWLVLPENFAMMGDVTAQLRYKESFGAGPIQTFLAEQAQKNDVWIVAGTIPIASAQDNKVRAACLVFDAQGKCVARYDKIHLFDVTVSAAEVYRESDTTEPGNHITVLNTPFGTLGLAVCYDIRFSELFRCLLQQGADIIVLPAAFTETTGKAHWEVLARSRAIENGCYFVGACQGGTHANGRKTYGHSIVVDPWGKILVESQHAEIIYASLDLEKVKEVRKLLPMQTPLWG